MGRMMDIRIGTRGAAMRTSHERFIISIMDTHANLLNMFGLPRGTLAFATDTNDLYIYEPSGFDKWVIHADTPT